MPTLGQLEKLDMLRLSVTGNPGLRSPESAALTQGLIQAGQAAALSVLRTVLLDFSGSRSSTLLRDLAEVLKSLRAARVVRMAVAGAGLRDEDLCHLAAAVKLLCARHMTTFHLRMDDNMLRGHGLCELVQSLHSAPALQELRLSWAQNDVDDSANLRLAKLLRAPGLAGLKSCLAKRRPALDLAERLSEAKFPAVRGGLAIPRGELRTPRFAQEP